MITGGIPALQLPPALAALAARPTPTVRPTLAALGGIPPAPVVTPCPAATGSVGCASGGKSACNLSPSQLLPTATPPPDGGFLASPGAAAAAAAAGVLILAGLAWFLISRRHSN